MEILGIWGFMLILGYVFGRKNERNHYKSIHAREKKLSDLITTNTREPLAPHGPIARCELVTGSVVISVDFFKIIAATLRGLVGGSVASYETLVDRARREAVLRLKESCLGANQIINLRIETVAITGRSPRSIGSVEVLAYGTAVFFEPARTHCAPA